MKLKEMFITHQSDEEQIMVSTDTHFFSGLVRSNRTAAEIVDCLKNETSKEEIVEELLKRYEVSKEKAEEDVERILNTLRKIGALDE